MRRSAIARIARAMMLMAALALPALTAAASAQAVAAVMRVDGSSPSATSGTVHASSADGTAIATMADDDAMAAMDGMPCSDAMPAPAAAAHPTHVSATAIGERQASTPHGVDHPDAPCGEGCCPQSSCDMATCVATALLAAGTVLPAIRPQTMPLRDARHAPPPSRWPDTPLRPPIG